MSLESNPAKRQRTDSDTEGKEVTRSKDIWFDDGNVVLQVASTQFRVHRSILARQSPVFSDMFTVPQPEGANSEWVDGCPLVQIFGDTLEDWEYVLSRVYCLTKIPSRWPSVPPLAAAIRLGKKYEFDELRIEAWELLKAQFPITLDGYNLLAPFTGLEEWILDNKLHILSIAEEAKLWNILPLTYFVALKCCDRDIYAPCYDLSANHLRSLAQGYIGITRDVTSEYFRWALPEAGIIPTPNCSGPTKCTTARTEIWAYVSTRLAHRIEVALDTWDVHLTSSSRGLCAECRREAQGLFDAGRERMWEKLGAYFLGDNWNELTDMDVSRCPELHRAR